MVEVFNSAIFLSASTLIFKRNILQEPQQQHKHSLFYYYPFCLCSAAARHDLYRVKIYITTCPYTKKKGKEKQKQLLIYFYLKRYVI